MLMFLTCCLFLLLRDSQPELFAIILRLADCSVALQTHVAAYFDLEQHSGHGSQVDHYLVGKQFGERGSVVKSERVKLGHPFIGLFFVDERTSSRW